MTTDKTVTIVGAGPAGLTAAIVLGKHGVNVRVYDASNEVGHRLSGDFQGLENWSSGTDITDQLKEIGIETNFLCAPYYGGTIYAPGMDPVEVRSDKPLFYLVRRGPMPGAIDRGLKEQARSVGVELVLDHRLDSLAGEAIVGTGPKGADVVAAGMTFETGMDDTAAVVLDDTIAPKGYAYLLVNGGLGTMATVLYRDFRRENEYFERTAGFFTEKFSMDIRNEKRFGGYGNFFMRNTQVHKGKLYIGESAGFQDCLWGFGMRYAIVSGWLAAKSIMGGKDYDSSWKRSLKPMLEASLVNRYLFEGFGHAAYRYITMKAASGDARAFLGRLYNPSLIKRILLPIAKMKYESRVKDKSCSHEDCNCVWCRCGVKECP